MSRARREGPTSRRWPSRWVRGLLVAALVLGQAQSGGGGPKSIFERMKKKAATKPAKKKPPPKGQTASRKAVDAGTPAGVAGTTIDVGTPQFDVKPADAGAPKAIAVGSRDAGMPIAAKPRDAGMPLAVASRDAGMPLAVASRDGGMPLAVASRDAGMPLAVASRDAGMPLAVASRDAGMPVAVASRDAGMPLAVASRDAGMPLAVASRDAGMPLAVAPRDAGMPLAVAPRDAGSPTIAITPVIAPPPVVAGGTKEAEPPSPPVVRRPVELRGRSMADVAHELEQLQDQLKNAEDNLRVVETQWIERAEPTHDEAMLRRFSDAEIQYLLSDFRAASVLFYDLVSDPFFQKSAKLSDALFFLADSLYQQNNLLGARVYLRQLLAMETPRRKEVLARFLDVAARTNEFAGIEELLQQATKDGGQLTPELTYVYGKWLFRRTDLTLDERLRRAMEMFSSLADNPDAPYRLQSMYYLGVAHVQKRALDRAAFQFQRLLKLPAVGQKDERIHEMANLSLGRLYYELGRYDDAVNHYQQVSENSDNFADSLFELAWCYVKKGNFELARNAADLMLLVAPQSMLAPEVKILQGHLQLKLKRYAEADRAYAQVVSEYGPVYDEVNQILTVDDPNTWFDKLLAKNDRVMDVSSLFPAEALKWATTQKEVADAMQMVGDLEAGRRGIAEASEIAERIIKAVDERGMESFPAIQEGHSRIEAVDAAVMRVEKSLTQAETQLIVDQLTPTERARVFQQQALIQELSERFKTTPTTVAEVEARRARMRGRVEAADKSAFRLGYDLQSLSAMVVAVGKWMEDHKSELKSTPEDRKAVRGRIAAELDLLAQLSKEASGLRAELQSERAFADGYLFGEDALRAEYRDALVRQHDQVRLAEPRLDVTTQEIAERAHQVRRSAQTLRERVAAAKQAIRGQLTARGQLLRGKVVQEQELLAEYQRSIRDISAEARRLAGTIAHDSFKRVKSQFYDLVLKANVGTVDTAFTRKQDKTQQIQKLSMEKDRELKVLEEEFREVLQDVE